MKILPTSRERRPALHSACSSPSVSPAHGALAILAFLILPLPAQSAANFNVRSPNAATATTEPQKNIKANDIQQSRYVQQEDMTGHIQTLSSIFTIRKRVTDPFGQYQDPDAKPVVKTTMAKIKRYSPAQATPFSDIVRLIKVTTVMPSEKSFLIGTRTIKQGDRIPLSFRGKSIKVEIAAVTSNAIEFRNTENGDRASVPLNLLPVGMMPGNDGINAPGMVADNPDAPIDLDSNSL